REFLHVGQGDFARQNRIVMRHVGLWVVRTVLVFHVHALTELLKVEPVPVHADLITDPFRLIHRGAPHLGHAATPFAVSFTRTDTFPNQSRALSPAQRARPSDPLALAIPALQGLPAPRRAPLVPAVCRSALRPGDRAAIPRRG